MYIFEASGDSDCLTISGPSKNKPCIFPFKYNGKTFHHCTNEHANFFWCATKTDSNMYMTKYGECDAGGPCGQGKFA